MPQLYTPFIERNVDKMVAASNERQQKDLSSSAYMGDQEALSQLYGVNPQLAERIQAKKSQEQQMKLAQQGQQQKQKRESFEALEIVKEKMSKMDFSQAQMYGAYAAKELGIEAPPLTPELHAALQKGFGGGDEQDFQMGTGAMSGYVFDKGTGKFSIDPEVKQKLDSKALDKVLEGKELDARDRQSINKDITGLIKETVKIENSAQSLRGLKKAGTPAARVAAVFSFMKAMDPTSTVRESEQGQVYAAEGAASQLAGSLNSLLGEGKLTDSGFKDLVDTAQGLANSAIGSSNEEVTSYLDSYGDTLPDKFKTALMRRIPKPQKGEPKQEDKAPLKALEMLKSDPSLAAQFEAKYGYLPEGS